MKRKNLYPLFILSTAIMVLCSCQTNERRIREIVHEEFASSYQRSAITNANVIGPYSPGQRVGNFVFVSGQIALNQETGKLENENIEKETRQALENLSKILRSAGFDSSDVISTTVYLKDINDYARMNNIYGGYFLEGDYPARVTVQVAALPRDARIEISAIAYHFQ